MNSANTSGNVIRDITSILFDLEHCLWWRGEKIEHEADADKQKAMNNGLLIDKYAERIKWKSLMFCTAGTCSERLQSWKRYIWDAKPSVLCSVLNYLWKLLEQIINTLFQQILYFKSSLFGSVSVAKVQYFSNSFCSQTRAYSRAFSLK